MDSHKEKQLIEAFRKARKSLVDYRYILLTHGEEEVTPAPFHYDWSDDLLHGTKNEAKQAFRESAKSQYVLRAFPLYALTFPSKKRDYIVIIKKNSDLARKKLNEIEVEFNTNPAVSGSLVEIKKQSAEAFSVDVKNEHGEVINVLIEAYGKGASVRGLANRDRRPKIVIIDDPQDIKDSQSDTVQSCDWEWFLSDVMFLGQHTRIFLIGNNLGEQCIIERVFNNAKELGFNAERISIEGEDGKSSWASKYKMDLINQEKSNYRKLGKIDVWMRERMCMASSEETRVFHRSDYRYYVPQTALTIAKSCNIGFTIDPASSKEKDSCYRAINIFGVDKDNKWFILDFPYGRWDSDGLIKVLFEKVKQWNPTLGVGIEKGMFKQIIEPFIYKEMSKRNIYFDIKPIEHAKMGSKLERVKMLGPHFKAHDIWFPQEAEWLAELESELAGVTKSGFKSLYVDLIDALAMTEQIADAPFGGINTSDLPRSYDTTFDLGVSRLPREAVSTM